jgi:thiamine-monophosphate kinase
MIDVTQGLIADLKQIAKNSGLGAEIYSPAVPIALETRTVADEMKEDVDKYAFYGGEDYEMLFTLKESQVEKLKAEFEDFSVIGKMSNEFNELRINTGEDSTIQFDL